MMIDEDSCLFSITIRKTSETEMKEIIKQFCSSLKEKASSISPFPAMLCALDIERKQSNNQTPAKFLKIICNVQLVGEGNGIPE